MGTFIINIFKNSNSAFIIIDKLELQRIQSEEMRKWQANWEDEEINDNFENMLKEELNANGQKLIS